MSGKKKIIVLLVLVWACLFVASYFMSVRIEGPRNLDTGFKRLDVLARYQIMALGVAVVSAGLGLIWRRESRWNLLVGSIPLLATALLVAGLAVAVTIFNARQSPEDMYQPRTPTAPAEDAQGQD